MRSEFVQVNARTGIITSDDQTITLCAGKTVTLEPSGIVILKPSGPPTTLSDYISELSSILKRLSLIPEVPTGAMKGIEKLRVGGKQYEIDPPMEFSPGNYLQVMLSQPDNSREPSISIIGTDDLAGEYSGEMEMTEDGERFFDRLSAQGDVLNEHFIDE